LLNFGLCPALPITASHAVFSNVSSASEISISDYWWASLCFVFSLLHAPQQQIWWLTSIEAQKMWTHHNLSLVIWGNERFNGDASLLLRSELVRAKQSDNRKAAVPRRWLWDELSWQNWADLMVWSVGSAWENSDC
jgi:hypothetical protein